MILKILFGAFSVILLVYLLLPGPSSVADFPGLPQSYKSQEPGDTVQVSNVAGYYSQYFRDFVIPFYIKEYHALAKIPFLPFRLNYPPEFAYTAIKDQTRSTYLEELFYPLRDSLFVNGFEPFYPDGTPKYQGATRIFENNTLFKTKTIIRFYPSEIWVRMIVWLGINLALVFLWKLGKQIL